MIFINQKYLFMNRIHVVNIHSTFTWHVTKIWTKVFLVEFIYRGETYAILLRQVCNGAQTVLIFAMLLNVILSTSSKSIIDYMKLSCD